MSVLSLSTLVPTVGTVYKFLWFLAPHLKGYGEHDEGASGGLLNSLLSWLIVRKSTPFCYRIPLFLLVL